MNTELRLFRIVDGTKKAVKITIDEDRLIVGEEYSDPVGGQSTPKDARDAALAGSGIKFHTDDQGRTIIDSVPQKEQEVISFFVPGKPCWFPGCEALRAEYAAELAAIGGANCTNCQQGALIRKYRPRVAAALDAATPSANAPATGPGQVS